MVLDFVKMPNGNHKAADYELLYNPLAKTWLVRTGTKKLASEIKGFAVAKEFAQTHFDENNTIAKAVTTKKENTTMAIKTRTAVKPAQTEVPEPVKTAVSKPVTRRTVPATAETKTAAVPAKAAAVKAKAVKPFPDFDTWAAENVTLLPVPKSGMKKAGIEDQNKKTLQGARLKHGKERAAYNKLHNLTSDVPAKTVTPKTERTPRVPAVKPPKMTAEEKYGTAFHKFGAVPTELEYLLAQLDNARCSKAYNICHSRKHPFSTVAKQSYLANVERCYIAEQKVWEESNGGAGLPKNFYLEYYNAKDVPQELVKEPKEGMSVLGEGHTIQGFGKLKLAAGVKLPVVLSATPAKKTAVRK